MVRKAVALGLLGALMAGPVFPHPGGLNSEGCHTNRKTGDHHCHRSGKGAAKAQRPNPAAPMASGRAPYTNCTAARRAGAAPVHAGDPGYSRKLDRDGDGIACE